MDPLEIHFVYWFTPFSVRCDEGAQRRGTLLSFLEANLCRVFAPMRWEAMLRTRCRGRVYQMAVNSRGSACLVNLQEESTYVPTPQQDTMTYELDGWISMDPQDHLTESCTMGIPCGRNDDKFHGLSHTHALLWASPVCVIAREGRAK